MAIHIERKPWWNYLDDDLKDSLLLSVQLSEKSAQWSKKFHDYSFIVFPAAKAYEGFLKKLFYDMGFISKSDYLGKHFRIGKSLNPDLDKKFRGDDWVYEKLLNYCKGKDVPEKLWSAWREARNVLFHWFPEEKNVIGHNEATERLLMIVSAIDEVFSVCKVNLNGSEKKQ